MLKHRLNLILSGSMVLLLIAGCGKPQEVIMESGLVIADKVVGTGELAEKLDIIKVHYTGKLENGTVFDSSRKPGRGPMQFTLGRGDVIRGWDEGIAGMRVGGKRILTIPPDLGYGPRGAGEVIPPNATLIFEVELLEVEKF